MVPITSAVKVKEEPPQSKKKKNLKCHQYLLIQERCKVSIEDCGRSDSAGNSSDNNLDSKSICSLHLERHIYRKRAASPTAPLPDKDTRSIQTQTDPEIKSSKEKDLDFTEERHSKKRKFSAVQNKTAEPSIRISRVIKPKKSVKDTSQANVTPCNLTPPNSKLREKMLSAIVQNEKLISEIETYQKNIKEEERKRKLNKY